jgi:hypothetical protein
MSAEASQVGRERWFLTMNTSTERYKALVEVFKGYLDTALTANIWFYAFTGAVVTYYLSNREGKPFLKFSLFIPFILGILIIVLSLKGKRRAKRLERKMLQSGGDAESNHEPPLQFLIDFLWYSVALIFLVCVCLIFLFAWWPPALFGV